MSMKMEWTEENVMVFLKQLQRYPCLWNPESPAYGNKRVMDKKWAYIKRALKKPVTIEELKKKGKWLMHKYQAYRTKMRQTKTFRTLWYAFPIMDRFLAKCDLPEIDDAPEVVGNEVATRARRSALQNEASVQDSCVSSQQLAYSSGEVANVSKRRKQDIDPILAEIQELRRNMIQILEINRGAPHDQQQRQQLLLLQQQQQQQQQQQRQQQLQQQQQQLSIDNDDCSLFGKLVALKLRKLSQERREHVTIKINKCLFLELKK